jgi:hypothetical protein
MQKDFPGPICETGLDFRGLNHFLKDPFQQEDQGKIILGTPLKSELETSSFVHQLAFCELPEYY